jgi:hypothetical protein
MNRLTRQFVIVLLCWLAAITGLPATAALAQSADKAPSPKVEQLLDLLGDGDIQAWLKTQKAPPPVVAQHVSADTDF